MATITWNKYIYVCGGHNLLFETLNTVEKYSIETDTWSFVSPMNFNQAQFSLVALGKYLYAVGGRVIEGALVEEVTYGVLKKVRY